MDALGNREEMTLLADQGVLVESDTAAAMFGAPFSIIPAHTLKGVRGIMRAAPAEQMELIAVYFVAEQVIYAEGGALIHCPTNTMALDAFLTTNTAPYDVLGGQNAAFVAGCLKAQDQMMAAGGTHGTC